MGRRKPKNNIQKKSQNQKHPAKRQRKTEENKRPHPVADENPDSDNSVEKERAEDDQSIYDNEDGPISAYQTLIRSLQSKGGSFSEAVAKRQREEQGMSSSDESEGNDNGESAEEMEDGEIEEDIQDTDNISEMDDPENGNPERDEDEKSGSSNVEENSDGSDEEENSPGSEEEDPTTIAVGGSDLESDDDADLNGHISCANTFKEHLDHNLEEKDAATLSKGGVKFKREIVAAGIQKAKWVTTSSGFPEEKDELRSCGVKLRLWKAWLATHTNSLHREFVTDSQCQFFNFCNSYRDILYSKRPCFHVDGDTKDYQVMDAYLLHVLNHILKTRDLVLKNNEKLSTDSKVSEVPRDQGFTRPKVLILLPMRSSALRLVKRILDLLPALQKGTVEHKARFLEEFSVEDSDSDEEDVLGKQASKPADHKALFGGNNDDHFRIGIKFTRKSVKLYSDFYSSDLIVASPLGLITRIGEAEQEKGKDVDFLSSIEVLVVDYADSILMQNWSHVVEIGEQLNQIPVQQHGTDFMRIREWFLNGHGRYYRQTIILSAFADAGINAFFHRSCFNHEGKIKLRCEHPGVLSKVLRQVCQVYERIDCTSVAEVDDIRFNVFVKQVCSQIKQSMEGGILIFVSSYFDFVRLRNFLKSESMSFCLLGEYTKHSDISRARTWFFHGKRRIMLYTERAHYYHRYKIRGIKELIFYSLPENAEFYAEITNMMEGSETPQSKILFSQFDNLKLERTVGTSRANKMLKSENRTFMFC